MSLHVHVLLHDRVLVPMCWELEARGAYTSYCEC